MTINGTKRLNNILETALITFEAEEARQSTGPEMAEVATAPRYSEASNRPFTPSVQVKSTDPATAVVWRKLIMIWSKEDHNEERVRRSL